MQLSSTHPLPDRHPFLWCYLSPLCISRWKVSAWRGWVQGIIAPSPLPPHIIYCKGGDIDVDGFFLLALGWSLWGHSSICAASSAPYFLILCHTGICSKWCGFINVLADGSLLPFKMLLPRLHESDEKRAAAPEGFVAQGLWGSPCTQPLVPETVHFSHSNTLVLQECIQESWAPEECSS